MAFVVNRPANEVVLVSQAGVSFTRLPDNRAMIVIDNLDRGEVVHVKPRYSERLIPVKTTGNTEPVARGEVMWMRSVGKNQAAGTKVVVAIDVALGDEVIVRGARVKVQKTHKQAVVRMHITAPREIPIKYTHRQRDQDEVPESLGGGGGSGAGGIGGAGGGGGGGSGGVKGAGSGWGRGGAA